MGRLVFLRELFKLYDGKIAIDRNLIDFKEELKKTIFSDDETLHK